MWSAHAVQEQQTVGVVDLVLKRHCLETVGADLHPLPRERELSCNDQTPASDDVPGEVRDRHAALATTFLASGTDDLSVAQDKRSVTPAGLGMTRHVEAEHPRGDADLLGGQTDATRRNHLGGKQIRDELDRRRPCRVDVRTRFGQHRVRRADNSVDSTYGQLRHHPRGGSRAHSRSLSVGER